MFLLKGLIVTLLYVFTFNHQILSVEGAKFCRTGNQEEGVCKSMKKCDSILSQLKKAEHDRNSKTGQPTLTFCGYTNDQPIVCCPSEKYSLNQFKGESFNSDVLLSPPNCGLSNSLTNQQSIPENFKKTEFGSGPWMVMLGYRIEKELKSWMCGGVLVSSRFVVTAAHCKSFYMVSIYTKPPLAKWLRIVGNFFDDMLKIIFSWNDEIDPSKMVVRLGASQVSNVTNGEIVPIDMLVEKIIVHQGYNKETLINDIALIKLLEDIHFTPSIQPICLPMSDKLMTNDYTDFMPVAAGWGTVVNRKQTSKALKETEIPVLPLNVCKTIYKDTSLNITDDLICAGYARGGNIYCQADSGGPLMLSNNNVTYLIGIESFGRECAKPGYPDVYTRVSSYIPWIARTIADNS